MDDAIGPQSVDVAQRQCFDPAFNPTYDVNSPYCAGVNRVANDGALGNILLTYYNNGRFETSGVDTQIDWSFKLGPGHFTLNSVFSYLISLKSAELISDPLTEFAGSLGPTQNELNAGSFSLEDAQYVRLLDRSVERFAPVAALALDQVSQLPE